MRVRTCVTFTSDAFNTRQSSPEFVHPENFGDDLARWLMKQFGARGVTIEEDSPGQEDHGWYITFKLDERLYDVVVTYVPELGSGRWLVVVERSVGLIRSAVGHRHRVAPAAVNLLNDVLQAAQECRDIRWLFFADVRRGDLTTTSTGPLTGL